MIKNIGFLVFILFAFSCGNNTEEVKIIASVEGVEDGTKVYRSTMGEENNAVPKDTVELQNGKFEFKLKDSSPQELGVIRLDNVNGNLFYIYEGENIEIKVYPDSINTSEIRAGKNNELMQEYLALMGDFRQTMLGYQNQLRASTVKEEKAEVTSIRKEMKAYENKQMKEIKNFADNNPESIVGLIVYSDLLNQKKVNNKELKEFYDSTSSEVKEHVMGRMIKKKIAQFNATDIGAVAPDFKGPTPDGGELELHQSLKKLTLVDFWASWCRPCRMENPNIVNIYKDYKDQGFHVIGVSLDRQNQEQKWIQAIEDDQLTWDHVSHLKFWKEPIAVQYGVRSIPQAYLLDEDGVIIAKNLRGNQLREKVAEYLEEN